MTASTDKRYVAALAKNGRLPKFAYEQKKDQTQEEVPLSFENGEDTYFPDALQEEKRHVGAFLKAHGKPVFSQSEGKRKIASMAKMGRAGGNAQFALMQPYSVGIKRMSDEDSSNNEESNGIGVVEDPDCWESSEQVESPTWLQSKRYVAALARNGRLPMWHAQRMWWDEKRIPTRPYFGAGRLQDKNEAANSLHAFASLKSKRCRNTEMGKRNVAALAKNGKLPFRSNA